MSEGSKRMETDGSVKSDANHGAEAESSSLHALMSNPLVANPIAAFAAATALGFGFASQMTGVMLGSMQTAMEASARRRSADQPAEDQPAETGPDNVTAPVVKVEYAVQSAPKPVKAVAGEIAVAEAPLTKRRQAIRTKQPNAAKPAPAKIAESKAKAEPKQATAPAAKPAAPARRRGKKDDLKAIGGIGPKMEELLGNLGVRSYGDIVAWTPEDAKRIDAELGLDGRIIRDDWIGQARKLKGV